MAEVDCRGYACPMPVIRTEKAMTKGPKETLVVLVDCATAKESVLRLAEKKGYAIAVQEQKGDFRLELTPAKS